MLELTPLEKPNMTTNATITAGEYWPTEERHVSCMLPPGGEWTHDEPPSRFVHLRRGDVLNEGYPRWLAPIDFQGSDYGGGTVGRSNFRVMLSLCEKHMTEGEYSELSGGHGSFGIAFRVDAVLPGEIVDRLNGLADYPVLDDDDLAEVEAEACDDAWRGLVHREVVDAAERLGVDVSMCDGLREAFESWAQLAGEDWSHSDSEGAYINVSRVMNGIDADDLLAIDGAVAIDEDE